MRQDHRHQRIGNGNVRHFNLVVGQFTIVPDFFCWVQINALRVFAAGPLLGNVWIGGDVNRNDLKARIILQQSKRTEATATSHDANAVPSICAVSRKILDQANICNVSGQLGNGLVVNDGARVNIVNV